VRSIVISAIAIYLIGVAHKSRAQNRLTRYNSGRRIWRRSHAAHSKEPQRDMDGGGDFQSSRQHVYRLTRHPVDRREFIAAAGSVSAVSASHVSVWFMRGAFLDHAVPGVGLTVSGPVRELTHYFTIGVLAASSSVQVTNSAGVSIPTTKPVGDPSGQQILLVRFGRALPPGTYWSRRLVSSGPGFSHGEWLTVGGYPLWPSNIPLNRSHFRTMSMPSWGRNSVCSESRSRSSDSSPNGLCAPLSTACR
jgi:hypothetical protein